MKIDITDFSISHPNTRSTEDRYYTLIDNHEFLDDNHNPCVSSLSNLVYAKAIANKKPRHISDKKDYYSYYIMLNTNNEPYNPIEIHSSIKPKPNFIDKICKSEWAFKEVDKLTFDTYLSFLRTKSHRALQKTRRGLK